METSQYQTVHFPAPFSPSSNTILPLYFWFCFSPGPYMKWKARIKFLSARQLWPKDTLRQVIIHHSDSFLSTRDKDSHPPALPALLLEILRSDNRGGWDILFHFFGCILSVDSKHRTDFTCEARQTNNGGASQVIMFLWLMRNVLFQKKTALTLRYTVGFEINIRTCKKWATLELSQLTSSVNIHQCAVNALFLYRTDQRFGHTFSLKWIRKCV